MPTQYAERIFNRIAKYNNENYAEVKSTYTSEAQIMICMKS